MNNEWLQKNISWNNSTYSSNGNFLYLNNVVVAVSYYIGDNLYVITSDVNVVDTLPENATVFNNCNISKEFFNSFSLAYCLYKGIKSDGLIKSQFDELVRTLRAYKFPIPDKLFQALSLNDVNVFNAFFQTPKRFNYMVYNKSGNWSGSDNTGGYHFPSQAIRVFEKEEDATFIKMKQDDIVIFDLSKKLKG